MSVIQDEHFIAHGYSVPTDEHQLLVTFKIEFQARVIGWKHFSRY